MGKFTISKILGRIFPKREGKKEHGGTHARRDWVILLLIFTLLNMIVIIFSTYLYMQINKGTIFVVENNVIETVKTFDQAELDDVLLFYEKREQEFERLKVNIPNIPSVR